MHQYCALTLKLVSPCAPHPLNNQDQTKWLQQLLLHAIMELDTKGVKVWMKILEVTASHLSLSVPSPNCREQMVIFEHI